MSDETKLKLSESTKKLWEDESYNKHMSESHKGQIPWNKGLNMWSEENKEKISGENNHCYGKKAHNSKLVLNLETGIFYESSLEASKVTNFKPNYFRRMLSGDRKNKTSFIYA
jgi:hypothetical protein